MLHRKMDASVLQRTAPDYRFTAVTQSKSDMKLNSGHKIESSCDISELAGDMNV